MDNFESRKFEAMSPILVEAGGALLDCQTLEYGIALFLFYMGLAGVPNFDANKMKNILDDVEKKTAGQLIGILKKYIHMTAESEQIYKNALDARNKIIHRYLIDNSENLLTEEGRSLVIKDIRHARKIIREGNELLRPAILKLIEIIEDTNIEDEIRLLKDEFLKSAN